MLREARNVKWVQVRTGFLGRQVGYELRVGGEAIDTVTQEQYNTINEGQMVQPVVINGPGTGKGYIGYRNQFYHIDDSIADLTIGEIKAVLQAREIRKKRKVERAKAVVEQANAQTTSRESIPDDVKTTVWRRDGGRCVRCGSQEKLEFDHIIPVSMGGSNTVRNIQLLCETCNREKGGNLV